MTRKSSRLVPAGIGIKPVVLVSLSGLVLCGFTAFMAFLERFMYFYGKITSYDDAGNRVFSGDEKMQPLISFNANFDIFKIFFLCMALLGVYFFLHHFIGSKSIYTMRRLKNPLEFYIRCLAVPVIFIILGIALIYILNFIYIEIYLALVPEEYLYPWWNANIWRDLL